MGGEGAAGRKIQYTAESQHLLSGSRPWEVSLKACKLEVPAIALSILDQR